MNKKFLIIISIVIVATIIFLFVLLSLVFPKVTITISPSADKITFDNKDYETTQIIKRLLPGKYRLKVEKSGYQTYDQDLAVGFNKAKFDITLTSNVDAFIKTLPETTPKWQITYAENGNQFQIQIITGPYQKNLAEAKRHLESQGIDLNSINIYAWHVAGVQ